MPFRHGIDTRDTHGGRPRRALTGLIVCGICGAELRASSRSTITVKYGPAPGQVSIDTERQATYECRQLGAARHLSVLALETEQRIRELVQRRTGRSDRAAIAAAVERIVVSPGVPGRSHFDPYRLRIVWRPLRSLL